MVVVNVVVVHELVLASSGPTVLLLLRIPSIKRLATSVTAATSATSATLALPLRAVAALHAPWRLRRVEHVMVRITFFVFYIVLGGLALSTGCGVAVFGIGSLEVGATVAIGLPAQDIVEL